MISCTDKRTNEKTEVNNYFLENTKVFYQLASKIRKNSCSETEIEVEISR